MKKKTTNKLLYFRPTTIITTNITKMEQLRILNLKLIMKKKTANKLHSFWPTTFYTKEVAKSKHFNVTPQAIEIQTFKT